MIRTLLVAFLIGHALLHAFLYEVPAPKQNPPPFDVHRSWALRGAHVAATTEYSASVWLGWLTTALFLLGAVGLGFEASWWIGATVAAAVVGLVLKIGWFHPWLSLGIALDIAILVAVTTAWPGSVY